MAGAFRAPSLRLMKDAAVELEGLTKFYGPQRGVEDITLAIQHGEVFGLLGPNGAGKTTAPR
jgi:ABC-2 type transport system ATP-binding protein